MNTQEENARILERAFPVPPENFDFAVRKALEEVQSMQKKHVRRTAILIAVLVLAVTGSALAIGQSIGVFNFFTGMISDDYLSVQPDAYDLVKHDLASYDFEHVTVSIKEAVYDGEMLRVVISTRDRAATAPFKANDEYGYLDNFVFEAADKDNIRWNIMDWMYIDGKDVCPEGETGAICGEENGEVLQYIQTYIDRSTLGDTFTVGFPLVKPGTPDGRREKDENGNFIDPTPKELTFTLSAADLKGVTYLDKPAPKDLGDYTATVTKAIISPIRVYLDIRFDAKEGAPTDIAETLEKRWFNAAVVDKDGNRILRSADSGFGTPYGDTETYGTASLLGKYLTAQTYPDTLYIAPVDDNDQPIMDMAIALSVPALKN